MRPGAAQVTGGTTSLAADPIGMDDFSGLETLIDFETILPGGTLPSVFAGLCSTRLRWR